MNTTNDSLLDALNFIQNRLSSPICILGILGNILAIVVCSMSRRLRYSTCGAYLMALSAYDSIYLCCQFVANLMVLHEFSFNNDAECGFVVFLLQASSCLSPLCVCAFTIERFVVVRYPLKRASVCTLSNVRKILLCMLPYPIITFTVLATVHGLNEEMVCGIKADDKSQLINAIIQVMDIFVSCLIPMMVIFVLNALIAKDLLKSTKRQQAMTEGQRATSRNHMKKEDVAKRKETQITTMLFIVATTFAVLNLPSYVIRMRAQYVLVVLKDTNAWTYTDEVVEKIATFMYIVNFAIDFLLYNASSKNFRNATVQVWKSVVCPRKCKSVGNYDIWKITSGSGKLSTTMSDVNPNGSAAARPLGVQENGKISETIA